MPRLLALGVGIVFALILMFFTVRVRTTEEVVDGFKIARSGTLAQGGDSRRLLLRRTRRGWVCVDALMYSERQYDNECIVYASGRGPGEVNYYVVCGERQPVLIASEPDGSWELLADGMRRVEPSRIVTPAAPTPSEPESFISVEEIRRRGLAQPTLGQGWCE